MAKDLTRMRRLGSLLWPHAREERSGLAVASVLGLVTAVLQLLQPWPLKWALDVVTGSPPHPASWLPVPPFTGLWTFGALYLGVSLAAAWAAYGHTMLVTGLVNRSVYRLRTALFGRVLRQPLEFHEVRALGELVTRIVYDTSRLRRGLAGLLLRVVQPVILFVLLLVMLVAVSPSLGALFGVGGLLALLVMGRRGRRIAKAAGKQRKKEGRLASLVADELATIREIQTFAARRSESQERFALRNRKSLRHEESVRRLATGLTLRTEMILVATTALTVWLGARAVSAGQLTPGDLLLFFSYALMLHRPLLEFSIQTTRIGRTHACADRLAKLTRRTAGEIDRPGAVAAPPLEGPIRFEGVAYRAPKRVRSNRKWTLHGLTCEFPAGRRTALLGPSGAGKSTLLRMLLGLTEPERGSVRFDGRDLREFQLASVRSQISVVFQDSVFTRQSVRENLALGLETQSAEAIGSAAKAARIEQWIEQLPRGYETRITQGGRLFSGGERQRLALARAILRNGRIWLLDEPTTGLDPDSARELTALLLDVTRGRTTVWITHDVSLVSELDWVVALADGERAFEGSPREYAVWSATAAIESRGGDVPCRP